EIDEAEFVKGVLDEYAAGLDPDRRYLFGTYEFVDMARKVVGVGSVGTRAWVFLFAGRRGRDPLVLAAKEAQAAGPGAPAGWFSCPPAAEVETRSSCRPRRRRRRCSSRTSARANSRITAS